MATERIQIAEETTCQQILQILQNGGGDTEKIVQIKALLENTTYGLSALKTLIGGVGKTLKTERAIKIDSIWRNASLTLSGPGAVFIVVKKGPSDYFYNTRIIIDGNSTGVGGVFATNYTAPSGNYNGLGYFVNIVTVNGVDYVDDYYFIPIFFKKSLVISSSSSSDATAMTILYNRYQ